jgi:hypothetical protein
MTTSGCLRLLGPFILFLVDCFNCFGYIAPNLVGILVRVAHANAVDRCPTVLDLLLDDSGVLSAIN